MNCGTTDEELNKLASERMMEIVKRMIEEKSQKRVEKYVDKV